MLLVAAFDAVFTIVMSVQLLTDRTCDGAATPHPAAAIELLTLCAALVAMTIFTQRRMARWLEPQSIIAGVATLLPALALAFANAFVGAFFTTYYAFHICLGLAP